MAILCNVDYTNWANDEALGNTSCVCLALDPLQIDVEPHTTYYIDSQALIAATIPLGGVFKYDGKNFFVNTPPTSASFSRFSVITTGEFYSITRIEDDVEPTPPPEPSTTTTTPSPTTPTTTPPTPPPTTTTCNPCYPFVPTTLSVPPPVVLPTTRTIAPIVMITTTPPPSSPLTISIVTTSTTVAPSTTSTTSTTTISPTTVPPSLIQPCKSGCNTLNF